MFLWWRVHCGPRVGISSSGGRESQTFFPSYPPFPPSSAQSRPTEWFNTFAYFDLHYAPSFSYISNSPPPPSSPQSLLWFFSEGSSSGDTFLWGVWTVIAFFHTPKSPAFHPEVHAPEALQQPEEKVVIGQVILGWLVEIECILPLGHLWGLSWESLGQAHMHYLSFTKLLAFF